MTTIQEPISVSELSQFRAGVPGIYAGIPAGDYFALDAVSASRLKSCRKSMAHCKWESEHPKESPSLHLGQATHLNVLQPHLLAESFGMCDLDGRTKAGKEARAEAELNGVHLFNTSDWDAVHGMAQSVQAHPAARQLLDDEGEIELSIVWIDRTDGLDGIPCKARIDKVSRGLRAVTDLKTTTDASPDKFGRAIFDYGYHIQGAHYLRGCAAVGIDADLFGIIAVESDGPYASAVYQLDDEALARGDEDRIRLMRRFAECKRTGIWPGYDAGATIIGLPRWARS